MSDQIHRELAVRRRLAFVRYLQSSAEGQCLMPEPMSVAGLLGLHDSVELFLVLACDVHNVGRRGMGFLDYFNTLEQKTKRPVSQRLALGRMNEARVALKHHGIWPSRQDLLDFRVVTRLFMQENSIPLFGIDIDEVSFADVVAYPEARAQLREAEIHMANARYVEAIDSVAVGLALAMWRFEYNSEGAERLGRPPSMFAADLFEIRSLEFERFLKTLEKRVLDLEYQVRLTRVGIDVRGLERFRSLTPGVSVAASGVHASYRHPQLPSPNAEDVRFCLDFAIDACIKLQQIWPPHELGPATDHGG